MIIIKTIFGLILAIALNSLKAFLFMIFWNFAMNDLFGFSDINFLQSIAIIMMSFYLTHHKALEEFLMELVKND